MPTCDPQTLVSNALCLTCIPTGAQLPVLINLLAQKAGVTVDAQTVTTAAKCIDCGVPPGLYLPIVNNLLCGIVGGSCTPQSLQNGVSCIECALPAGMVLPAAIHLASVIASGSNDATTLMAQAKCLDCGLSPGLYWPAIIYLLATIANVSTDPQTLITNSKCIDCGLAGMAQWAVFLSLLCNYPTAPVVFPVVIIVNDGSVIDWTYSGPEPDQWGIYLATGPSNPGNDLDTVGAGAREIESDFYTGQSVYIRGLSSDFTQFQTLPSQNVVVPPNLH